MQAWTNASVLVHCFCALSDPRREVLMFLGLCARQHKDSGSRQGMKLSGPWGEVDGQAASSWPPRVPLSYGPVQSHLDPLLPSLPSSPLTPTPACMSARWDGPYTWKCSPVLVVQPRLQDSGGISDAPPPTHTQGTQLASFFPLP